jgi:hypothetical protein
MAFQDGLIYRGYMTLAERIKTMDSTDWKTTIGVGVLIYLGYLYFKEDDEDDDDDTPDEPTQPLYLNKRMESTNE